MRDQRRLLVHLATGIGNIVLATPLLVALSRRFEHIELRLDADYPGVGDLFRSWSALRAVHDASAGEIPRGSYDMIVPAIPPFAWPRFAGLYSLGGATMRRPADAMFYADEQAYYLDFARRLGCGVEPTPYPFIPAAPCPHQEIGPQSLVLAPGCKTGIMAAKRWPYFPELAEEFDDVVIVGTEDDLRYFDGRRMAFPHHARSLVDRLSLAELAGVLAGAGMVVANDSGIGHLAAATGAAVILIFGPTPHDVLGAFPPNATVLRAGLRCQPCWLGSRLSACGGQVTCLRDLPAAEVARAAARCIGPMAVAATGRFHD